MRCRHFFNSGFFCSGIISLTGIKSINFFAKEENETIFQVRSLPDTRIVPRNPSPKLGSFTDIVFQEFVTQEFQWFLMSSSSPQPPLTAPSPSQFWAASIVVVTNIGLFLSNKQTAHRYAVNKLPWMRVYEELCVFLKNSTIFCEVPKLCFGYFPPLRKDSRSAWMGHTPARVGTQSNRF